MIGSGRDLETEYQRMGFDLYSRNRKGGFTGLNIREKLNDVQNPRI